MAEKSGLSPLLFLPPLLFVGLAALFFLGLNRENPDALPTALAGKPAPAVMIEPLGEGAQLTDAMIRAPGVKLVNFWASWCAPCRVEHPNLEELAAGGLTIYGVNYKDKPRQALGFLDELGDPYAALGADPAGRMAIEWGVYGVPETFVVDGNGRIIARVAGPVTDRALETTLRPAIAEARAPE
ncbi:DsbE family thiol:disulfide interchange protein [Rhodovulum sp. YNF3179]|uniref:DsbE family thiol:disulfide interchange protein n=1 Tax=Rhodovulum sp. YNF3179 TaxID=3425127 RepID=UPI003D34527D